MGDNVPINGGARDPLDAHGNNSPTLVANPKDPANLFVANRVDVPQFSCAAHVSLDGGGHWADIELPRPPGEKVVPCFAPDASFGPDGKLYVAYTSFAAVEGSGTVPDSVWIVVSSDGGRTFASPLSAGPPLAFHVRVLADPTRGGRVYLAWLRAAGAAGFGLTSDGNPLVVSRSDNGGRTWSEPVVATPAARLRVIAPSLAVDGNGEVYLAYVDVGEDKLDYLGAHEGRGGDAYPGAWQVAVARSSDAGASWSDSVVETALTPARRFLQLFPPTPSIAVDPGGGAVYVAFDDARRGDGDVLVWRSPDGARWSAPVRVNDTPLGDGTSQYLASASVAPGGRVDVVYYDRRADAKDVRNEVSVQSSFDGARTFGPRLRISQRSFDSRIGFGSDRGLTELGNRLGLVSTDAGLLALWADTRAGGAATGRQDLAAAVVAVTGGSGLYDPIRMAGFALMAMGGLVVAWSVVAGRSMRRRDPVAEGQSAAGRPSEPVVDEEPTAAGVSGRSGSP